MSPPNEHSQPKNGALTATGTVTVKYPSREGMSMVSVPNRSITAPASVSRHSSRMFSGVPENMPKWALVYALISSAAKALPPSRPSPAVHRSEILSTRKWRISEKALS